MAVRLLHSAVLAELVGTAATAGRQRLETVATGPMEWRARPAAQEAPRLPKVALAAAPIP
jgi:hypothetical protein